jgi:hypothetical protein
MWYVTFHSVDTGYNICAYDDSGRLLTPSVLQISSGPKNFLKKAELRGIGFAADHHFYVVNAKESFSEILRFSGKENSDHSRQYKSVFTSGRTVNAIDHPFAFAIDPVSGNFFISSQDTNLVTQVLGPVGNLRPGTAAPVSSALSQLPKSKFLDGTFVGSSYTNLPAYITNGMTGITPVAQPGGLDASPNDGSRVKHSIRDIVHFRGNLYVADEAGNALKIYDGASGAYQRSVTLPGPIHLLCVGNLLYASCSGDNKTTSPVSPSVVCYNPNSKVLSTVVSDKNLLSVSGIAFGADGNFYLADRTAQTIRRYAPKTIPFTPIDIFIDSQSNSKNGLPDQPEFLLYVS